MEKLEDLKIMAEQWWNQGIEYLQKIPPTQLYTSIGVLLYTTILLLLYSMYPHSSSLVRSLVLKVMQPSLVWLMWSMRLLSQSHKLC
ncbi:hypothetical protein Bca4012_087845 [Brassica carinata]